MLAYTLSSLLSLVLALPSVQLALNRSDEVVSISLAGDDELLEQCIKSGFTLSYNFETKICKKRLFWTDDCLRRRRVKHLLTYDSITSKYRLNSDVLGDLQDSETAYYATLNEAKDALYKVKDLPLNFVAHRDATYYTEKGTYLQSRVTSDCIGGHNQTIGDISYYLTLGFYRMSGFNTGWYIFSFKPFLTDSNLEANPEE